MKKLIKYFMQMVSLKLQKLYKYIFVKQIFKRRISTKEKIEVLDMKILTNSNLKINSKDLIIGVIVTSFYRTEFLDDLLYTIANATHRNHEVIITIDNKIERSDKYLIDNLKPKSKHQIVKIILHKQNYGLGAARQTALNHTSAPLIKFLDSDDFLWMDSIDNQVEEIIKSKSSIVLSNYAVYFKNSGEIVEKNLGDYFDSNYKQKISPTADDILLYWEKGITIPIHTALFRREILPELD